MAGEEGGTIGARHASLHAQVVTKLRDLIVSGDVAPGERLTEEMLAARFGVSRNPVREAIRVLEAEGFLRVLPRRGAVVATPDSETVEDLYAVRSVLEPLAARLAAPVITDECLDTLRALLGEGEQATADDDYPALAAVNTAFHLAVIEASGNRWLIASTRSVYRHVQWVFRLGAPGRAPHSWTEHVGLLDALAARDPEKAERAAREHVRAAYEAARVLPLASPE